MMHHTTNIAAVVVPLGAWAASWIGLVQPFAAFLLTILGIAYYVQYFYRQWKSRRADNA